VPQFVGTTLFLLFALSAANIAHLPSTSVTGITAAGQAGSTAQILNTSNHIAFGFGISLTVTAWVFFRVSGGLFNPAITLGMLLVGALSPLRAAILAFVQLLGGIVGTALLDALTPGTLNVRTTLAPGMSVSRGLFLEATMTALLMLAILLLAAEKSRVTYQAPLPIGLALFISQLASGAFLSLGPARTFGPDVVLHTFENYTWIYFLGPALGATIAALFYRLIKFLEYETVL
ncbi:aquaporin-like protein, partial [Rhodotorula sp. JG-1b]